MQSLVDCPYCLTQAAVPPVGPDAVVRCPTCQAEFPLELARRANVPLLVVVRPGTLATPEPELAGLAAAASWSEQAAQGAWPSAESSWQPPAASDWPQEHGNALLGDPPVWDRDPAALSGPHGAADDALTTGEPSLLGLDAYPMSDTPLSGDGLSGNALSLDAPHDPFGGGAFGGAAEGAAPMPAIASGPPVKRKQQNVALELIKAVLGGAVGLTVAYAILLWGCSRDPLQLRTKLPKWAVPAHVRN